MNWGSGLVVKVPGVRCCGGSSVSFELGSPVSRRRYEAATFEVWGQGVGGHVLIGCSRRHMGPR